MTRNISAETIATRTYLDDKRENRPLSAPIIQGSVFTSSSAEEHARLFQSSAPTVYIRFGHPNSDAVAEKIAALEGAQAALAFSSGMAAVSSTLMAFVESGRKIVISEQCFEQTERFVKFLGHTFGIETDFVDTTDLAAVEDAISTDTSFVYVETPSNPHLKISDIRAISRLAESKGDIPVFVDSTFATPFGQRPIELGASLVLHSGTKFLAGHHDLMCGFVAGHRDFVQQVKEMQVVLGGVLDPHSAWLAARSLKTLGLRMTKIGENALDIAEFLDLSEEVAEVRFPLFKKSAGYSVANKQMRLGGGVVAFRMRGGAKAARALLDSLKLIHIATSLGGIETTIQIPYDLDWHEKMPESGKSDGLVDTSLIRLSVGIEDIDDLVEDLADGLNAVAKIEPRSD